MSAIVSSKPKPPAPGPSSIRRFVIRATEYDDVLKWLKRKSLEVDQDDEKLAVVVEKTYRVPTDFFPKIKWVHGRELQLQKGAHGKEYIGVLENQI